MTAEVLKALLACAIGYLLGSLLPADLLARWRDVDIRSVGDGNPGTVNAFRGLGWPYGVMTAVYDVSVGIGALGIARFLGLGDGPSYLAGIMAVVGHRFPLFSGFRGGQGMAASTGLLLYGVGVALTRGWLSVLDVVALAAISLTTLALTRSDRAIAVVMLPVLVIRLAVARPGWQYLAFMTAVAGNIWVVQLMALRHQPKWFAVRTARH